VIKEERVPYRFILTNQVDVLFIIDNSRSMFGEQKQLGESIDAFTRVLDEKLGDEYQIGIITTGVQSEGCPLCREMEYPGACINDTDENGRLQDWIGQNIGSLEDPLYEFTTDPACGRIITSSTKNCFYDVEEQKGIAMVGVEGCGYERGFATMRRALGDLSKSGGYNDGFLRENATLAVVVISDEDDCGEVDEVTEDQLWAGSHSCYYAAKGVDPEGNFNDPRGKPFRLTPVEEYYDFLMGLKNNREGMVKFAAIVGVRDVGDLSTTKIEYFHNGNRWDIENACEVANCPGNTYCYAKPGTRYIEMAQMFGLGKDGYVDTICQNDFSETMGEIAEIVTCPEEFLLSEEILDPDLANILINGEPVPRYTCKFEDQVNIVECSGLEDDSCPGGRECVETWEYHEPTEPPEKNAEGGKITFAPHYDPCEMFETGDEVHIELVYVTK